MYFKHKLISVETETTKAGYFVLYDEDTMQIELPTTAYLVDMRDNGSPNTTIINHAETLKHFLNHVYSKPLVRNWNKVHRPEMEAYINARARDLKETSFNSNISRLKGFFGWVFKTGWLDQPAIYKWNPDNEIMRKKKEEALESSRHSSSDPFNLWHQYISPTEFEYFLGFNSRKATFLRERDEIIFKLGYYSGWRRSETINPTNINLSRIKDAIREADKNGLNGFTLNIIGKGKKGGKVREVYIPAPLKEQILNFINGSLKRNVPNSDLLICKVVGGEAKHLGIKHPTNLFAETLRNLLAEGEQEDSHEWRRNEATRRYHSLRHSYATNEATIIRLNNDSMKRLQQRMGHTYPESTDIYIHFEAVMAGDLKRAELYDPSSSRARREFKDDED